MTGFDALNLNIPLILSISIFKSCLNSCFSQFYNPGGSVVLPTIILQQCIPASCLPSSVSTALRCFKSAPEVLKLFSCSTELSVKFILFINVKMPTIGTGIYPVH